MTLRKRSKPTVRVRDGVQGARRRGVCLGRGGRHADCIGSFPPFGLCTLKYRGHCRTLDSSVMSWLERVSLAIVLGMDK